MVSTFEIKYTKNNILKFYSPYHQFLEEGKHLVLCNDLLFDFNLLPSVPYVFLGFFVTKTCAPHGDLLGFIIPSSKSLCVSFLIDSSSCLVCFLDLTAIGLQSLERCINSDGRGT